MLEQINTLIDTLSLDHRRGAAEIVQDASELFLSISLLAQESPLSGEHVFERAIRRLARGQPTMAPVLNLLSRVCRAKEEAGDDWEVFSARVKALAQRRADLVEMMKRHISDLPPVPDLLLTFSNSSTVAKIIATAHFMSAWPKSIFCGEGRPMMEGLVMARKLTSAGLDVTVFTDGALMSRVREAQAVWVGGDSLSRDGLVNKVGSNALARLAKFSGIPFVSMIGSDKFLSSGMTPYFTFLPQNPREIGADDTDSLNVHNEYYEIVPLDLVSHILTENGVFKPGDLVQTIEEEPVAPLFESILKG